jgi:hypothetical protein
MDSPVIPKEFFTLQSMLTLAGAAGATFVVSNGLQAAFNFNPKWLALAVAQVIILVGTKLTGGTGSDYFVAVINGFLVFATTAGATHALGSSGTPAVGRGAQEASSPQPLAVRRRFLTPWF